MSSPLHPAHPAPTAGRIFSATKWISGVTVLSVVADSRFKLELDDLASDHLAWWSTDRDDLRSGVTLRHLLGECTCWLGAGLD